MAEETTKYDELQNEPASPDSERLAEESLALLDTAEIARPENEAPENVPASSKPLRVEPPRPPKTSILTSIRGKLFLAMTLIAGVPLVLTVLVTNFVTTNSLEEQTGESVEEVAARTADLLSTILVENVHLVQSLVGVADVVATAEAANAAYGPEDPAAIVQRLKAREAEWSLVPTEDPLVGALISEDRAVNPAAHELHRFQEAFPRHAEILVTDSHGALVAATDKVRFFYFADMPWWQGTFAAGQGQVFIGQPMRGDDGTAPPKMILGVPVIDDQGRTIGAVCSMLDVAEFRDILRQVNLGQTGRVRVFGAQGELLFAPEDEQIGQKVLPTALAEARILASQGSGWLRGPSRDDDAIFGHAKATRTAGLQAAEDLGWTTVASQDADEALQAATVATQIQIAVALVVALLAILGSVIVSRLLTRQIDRISELFEAIRAGDYAARAPIESRDELGRMTADLNTMLDDTLNLIQSREERDTIQGSVMRLLEEVSDVAQGDLRVRAEVTPDITGAIADSFNYMIAELRRIIGDVQETSVQVTATAGTIKSRMVDLADGSSSQSEQILDTSERLKQMTGSIRQVSENARVCSEVAAQSLDSARRGNEAVGKTITGMTGIRGQVREASKRLKRLGESSQEIGQIVKLISEISDRTSVLALNASIQAAAAGEAGESFAVVAEEVEQLAERTAGATQRIETLIKTVQVETAETMAAMEDATREVVDGSEIANAAGQSLDDIETVSERLASLVRTITEAAEQQAQSSEILSRSMSEISQITQRTASGTREAADEAEVLAGQADTLRDSVRRFTVPSRTA